MRRDIQFLRGIAVLFVVLYHSNIGILSQGYLGVDIFFVLSGFLITSLILKQLDKEEFSFSAFYLRRAKRLLPALYSTLFFTSLLSLAILTHQQWLDYLQQLIGALTFSANMVLPTQTGYFESTSEGKPLLHIWSLSLEEQYYFLLPITLFLIPKKLRLFGLFVLFIVSLYWCLTWVYNGGGTAPILWRLADASMSEWAFYLLFTRAWELLAGSLCAWFVLNKPSIRPHAIVKCACLLIIFIICTVNVNNEHPSLESFIIVIATSLILLGDKEWLPDLNVFKYIEKIGDWSYSIYLVHWPLFAFAYLSYVGHVPFTAKVLLIFISIFLGYAQFVFVETPFRLGRFKNNFTTWRMTSITTAFLLTIPLLAGVVSSSTIDEYAHIKRNNYGLSQSCNGSFEPDGTLKEKCISGKPTMAIWGDSYAMHLVPGLAVNNKNFVQLTKSMCGPISGVAPIKGNYDSIWAKECLYFNEQALNYILNNNDITHVVLSSTLITYLDFENGQYQTTDGTITADLTFFLKSFIATLRTLQSHGKTTVIISPPPKSGFDIGECLERKYGGALLLRDSCKIDFNEYASHQKLVNEVLQSIESQSTVIWLKDYLCSEKSCRVDDQSTFLYRDSGHLSVGGSILLLKNIDIKTY
ncbi:acyltransferase family protein [Thalassotalea sp. PP2-459]|uniref:acyltransferase family protein n=1 Tax=Thalassotalea sp. PP2-459 TaxID=1742724 RepID=UPI000942ED93|nr:acyltransferase family protein [Thalassotalea sp. PP2-459]OKY26699.1 hypothetical protein BI291_01525 [Thalassotalea sp. PP2-459]